MYTNRYLSSVGKLSLRLALATTLLLNSFCFGAEGGEIRRLEKAALKILLKGTISPISELLRMIEQEGGTHSASIRRMREEGQQEQQFAIFPALVQRIHERTAGLQDLSLEIQTQYAQFRASTLRPIELIDKIRRHEYPRSGRILKEMVLSLKDYFTKIPLSISLARDGYSDKEIRRIVETFMERKCPSSGATKLVEELIPSTVESCHALEVLCDRIRNTLEIRFNALNDAYVGLPLPAALLAIGGQLDTIQKILLFNKNLLSPMRAGITSISPKNLEKLELTGNISFFDGLSAKATIDDLKKAYTARFKTLLSLGCAAYIGLPLGGGVGMAGVFVGGLLITGAHKDFMHLDELDAHIVQIKRYPLFMTSLVTLTRLTTLRYVIEQCSAIQNSLQQAQAQQVQAIQALQAQLAQAQLQLAQIQAPLPIQGQAPIPIQGPLPIQVGADQGMREPQGQHEAEEEHIEEEAPQEEDDEKEHRHERKQMEEQWIEFPPPDVEPPNEDEEFVEEEEEQSEAKAQPKEEKRSKKNENKKLLLVKRLQKYIARHESHGLEGFLKDYSEQCLGLINHEDDQGRTSLFTAVEKAKKAIKKAIKRKQVDIVQLLLKSRADVMHKDKQGRNAYSLISKDEPRHQPIIELLVAAAGEHTATMIADAQKTE